MNDNWLALTGIFTLFFMLMSFLVGFWTGWGAAS